MSTYEELRQRCAAEGQEHVFGFWHELDAEQRDGLLAQIASIDWSELKVMRELLAAAAEAPSKPHFEPPELFPLERDERREEEAAQARLQGARMLEQGLVANVLVAGGQGSRLGFDGPKGLFPIGPLTGASLFEWHASRLAAARERHGAPPVWYVMTSATNDAETRRYFEQYDYFGLGRDHVRFFQQAMLPALDPDGRMLLSAPDTLFLAPNGHGGTLSALATSGCLADAAQRGIEVFSYFQVDSPMARPADTLFLGLHAVEGAAMSSKVVSKRDAHEKVGVIGRANGRLGCIEYSDLPDDLRDARDAQDELLFRAGNIALHAIDRRFVEELTESGLALPYHLARKKVDVVDPEQGEVQRDAIKFETFVFDALGMTEKSITLEVDRAEEFSPVKNASGDDSPATVRQHLTELFAGWLQAAGAELPPAGPDGTYPIEVDPRFAEDAEEFARRLPARPQDVGGGHLYK